MTETAVIVRPNVSRPIISSLCLKLRAGLSGGFFCVFLTVRGLEVGLVFGLTLACLRGDTGLFMQESYSVPTSIAAHKLPERYFHKHIV